MKTLVDLAVVLVLLCALCAGAHAAAIEVPLHYERYPDSDIQRQILPWGHARLNLMSSPPVGEWKFPKAASRRPLYAWVALGEQERLIMLDKSGRRAQFYDRAYFDANGNRDLTDDPGLIPANVHAPIPEYCAAQFTGIDTAATIQGVSQPYSFSLHIRYWSDQPVTWWAWFKGFFSRTNSWEDPGDRSELYASLQPFCMYTANLDLDGVEYRIYLGDGNANGRFDDYGVLDEEFREAGDRRVRASGDAFYLVRADAEVAHDGRHALGRYLNLSDRLYAVEIAQTEHRMTLTPVREAVARVELPLSPHRITLMGETAGVMVCAPGTTILAPPGAYRLVDYVLFREEPEGARWKLRATGTWAAPEIQAVVEDVTSYTLGEPFRPTVEVPKWSRSRFETGDDMIHLNMEILGSGGEIVSEIECVDSPEKSAFRMAAWGRPKEASYRIVQPDGEVAAQGTFEYG